MLTAGRPEHRSVERQEELRAQGLGAQEIREVMGAEANADAQRSKTD